jgi:hypothetical protein
MQGAPLPDSLQVKGQWVVEGFLYLYIDDTENVATGTFSRQAGRLDDQLCVGFNAASVARSLGVDVATLMDANSNRALAVLGTAKVPPQRGGRDATAYGFRLGDKEGYVTIEGYDEGTA